MICLDTSFLIRALVKDSPEGRRLARWLERGDRLAISVIAWAEFLCGPVETEHLELLDRIVPERLSLTEQDAVLAAGLYNDTGRRRGTLVDCLIAATALRKDAPLATSNPSDFEPMTDLGLQLA